MYDERPPGWDTPPTPLNPDSTSADVPYWTTPPPPKKKSRMGLVLGAVFAVVALLCLGGLMIAASNAPDAPTGTDVIETTEPATTQKKGAAPVEKQGAALTAADIELKVKITEQVFMEYDNTYSVVFKIEATADTAKLAARGKTYDITYEVKGLKSGSTTGTLVFALDGTYSQDGYQYGDTKGKPKLTAKVTDVHENLN